MRLTDRYPNIKALERLRARCEGKVDYECSAVDATAVPEERTPL